MIENFQSNVVHAKTSIFKQTGNIYEGLANIKENIDALKNSLRFMPDPPVYYRELDRLLQFDGNESGLDNADWHDIPPSVTDFEVSEAGLYKFEFYFPNVYTKMAQESFTTGQDIYPDSSSGSDGGPDVRSLISIIFTEEKDVDVGETSADDIYVMSSSRLDKLARMKYNAYIIGLMYLYPGKKRTFKCMIQGGYNIDYVEMKATESNPAWVMVSCMSHIPPEIEIPGVTYAAL